MNMSACLFLSVVYHNPFGITRIILEHLYGSNIRKSSLMEFSAFFYPSFF